MIVVDSNVLVYLHMPTAMTEAAQAWLEREPNWAAPRLWRSEVRNALSMHVRRGDVAVDDAIRLQSSAEALLARGEFDVPSDRVLRLAAVSGCTSYDCEFVALAEVLGVKLLTHDRRVLEAFPDVAVGLAIIQH